MLIVTIGLIILAIVVGIIADDNGYEGCCFFAILGAVVFGIISLFIIIGVISGYINGFTINDKITMYKEENKNIESQITTIVNNYQGYEKDIISNVADMEVLLIKIPELKTSELVKTQMKIYIENNKKIKELKEDKINMKIYKWLLYFGK